MAPTTVTATPPGASASAWALLVLLCPIGMLWLHPLAEELAVGLYGGGPNASWTTLAAAAIVVAVAAAIVVAAALMVQRRVAFTPAAVERCAACGRHARRHV